MVLFHLSEYILILFVCAGIATANYSHVQYFKDRETYDDFYGIMLRVVDIGVLSFADAVQSLLVKYLRLIDPPAAEWFRENWCGERGLYCLCHASYGGSNSNMGVEVDWRDIKKLCPTLAKLGTFSALIHFVLCQGKEQGLPGAFIWNPVPIKQVWDSVQDVHLKTLLCSIVTAGRSEKLEGDWVAMVCQVSRAGCDGALVHLQIVAWHEDIQQFACKISMKIADIKTILMPRHMVTGMLTKCETFSWSW
jgi:hypothetical protein